MSTIAEQILSTQVDRPVTPGEIAKVPVDFVFGHDVTLPPAIEEFDRLDVETVFDPDSIAVIPDHLVPAHDEHAASLYAQCKRFATEHDTVFYPQGTQGQEHVVIPEDGLVTPGDVVVGADSHTCTEGALGTFSIGVGSTDIAFAMAFGWLWVQVPETTRITMHGDPAPWTSAKDLALEYVSQLGADGAVGHALEFGGETVWNLEMDGRFTLSNMAVEVGAGTGIIEPDATTAEFVEQHADAPGTYYHPENPDYETELTIDCEGLEPRVAVPDNPANVRSVTDDAVRGTEIDQAVIGSCTNGRENDLRTAARILEENEVAQDVRLIITPGSKRIEQLAISEGWTETFLAAGATMETPGCGACFGMRTGVLGEDEVAVSTTNRNFPGRMGHQTSSVYLASPAVAAASAVTGEITHPGEVV